MPLPNGVQNCRAFVSVVLCICFPLTQRSNPLWHVQMHQLDSAVTGRLEAVEGHLQLIAGVLGTKLAGTPDAQPLQAAGLQTTPGQLAASAAWDLSGISIMQQLSDLHIEMSRLSQDQLQVRSDAQTSETVSSDLDELRHRLHGQEAETQQLQQAHSDALLQAAVLQQGLSAQENLTDQMQQTQQSLTLTVDGMASDLARHVNDMQDAHSQLETQHASTSSQISEEMSQHHVDLCKLRAASAAHDEQLKQHGETLRQHEAQLARSAASQQETQEALRRLNEHTGAISSHNTGLSKLSLYAVLSITDGPRVKALPSARQMHLVADFNSILGCAFQPITHLTLLLWISVT